MPKILSKWLNKDIEFGNMPAPFKYNNGDMEYEVEIDFIMQKDQGVSVEPFGILPNKKYSGKWYCWDNNGVIRGIFNIVNGQSVGMTEVYDPGGELEMSYLPSKNMFGRPILIQTEFLNGSKYEQYSLSSDFNIGNDGVCKIWYSNKNIKNESIYDNGKIQKSTFWNENGSLNKKEYYDDKGNFIKRELYKDNKLTKTETTE